MTSEAIRDFETEKRKASTLQAKFCSAARSLTDNVSRIEFSSTDLRSAQLCSALGVAPLGSLVFSRLASLLHGSVLGSTPLGTRARSRLGSALLTSLPRLARGSALGSPLHKSAQLSATLLGLSALCFARLGFGLVSARRLSLVA